MCLYATDFASTISTFVHPKTDDTYNVLAAKTFIYDSSASTVLSHATDTIIGSTTGIDESVNRSAGNWESDDLRDYHYARVDSYANMGGGNGTFDGVTMIKSYPSGAMKFEADYLTQAHMYGYSTCEAFGRCSGEGVTVGSSCAGGRGFCFTSGDGTLECGRTISTQTRFGNNVQNTVLPPKPCPRGTPAVNGLPPGTVVVAKRFLIAGCMITGDNNYLPSAEVHVPQACAQPAHYKPGCLFPGALNYNPGAAESAFCKYETSGCMDPSAHNYNSLATQDDGSCITKILGCTIKTQAYDHVDAATPGYLGLYHDDPLAHTSGHTGEHANWHHTNTITARHYQADNSFMQKAVTNYDSSANALSGCIVAIEGCSDSSAANYDPLATINSATWCVPRISGCMDPVAWSYDSSATVHEVTACKYVRGCMSQSALNYDSKADYDWGCYEPIAGCLDSTAGNFGCDGATSNCVVGASSPKAGWALGKPVATVHAQSLCRETIPSDQVPSSTQSFAVRTGFAVAGVASELATSGKTIQDTYNDLAGGGFTLTIISLADPSVSFTTDDFGRRRLQEAGSEFIFLKQVGSLAEASAGVTALESIGMTKDTLSTAFQAAGVSVTVLTDPVSSAAIVEKFDDGSNSGAVIGIVVGVIAVILLAGAAFMYMQKKKQIQEKTVVPA